MDETVSKPEINDMTSESIVDVEAIERQCFSLPWSADSLIQELSNPLAVFRTADVGGKIVGYAGMHHIIDEGYITNVAVLPDYRGRGVARALMEDMLHYARENELSVLTLEVRESNSAAQALYHSLNFEIVGKRKKFYTLPVEDGVIMTRKL